MGVTKLWQLLEDVDRESEPLSLASCSGQAWAVDLSGWIVHGRTAARISGVSQHYVLMKTVFFRALCLLSHGIVPIFVMDGSTAPKVKEAKMQQRCETAFGFKKLMPGDRSSQTPTNQMCRFMLESLGLTVVTSSGEAEKTCALLNQQGVVNGCLTDDGDAFLYGAMTVYRNMDVKLETVERYTAEDIEKGLQLTRRDLVVMALLSGCDYGEGVSTVGPKKVCDLIKDMKVYEEDILTRVLGWKDNSELQKLAEQEEKLRNTEKSTHCSKCQHPGTKSQHKSKGCSVCKTAEGCSEHETAEPCGCTYHLLEQEISPCKTELTIRQKAIQTEGFPDKKLVSEFLEDEDESVSSLSTVSLSMPDWPHLIRQVKQHLRIDAWDLMKKMVPVLVHMHLYKVLDVPGAKPISIQKTCKRNFVWCYQVLWERFAFDEWSPETLLPGEKTPDSKQEAPQDTYIVAVPCPLLKSRYPELVDKFEQDRLSAGETASKRKKKSAGKRTAENPAQLKLTSFLTVKKRLFQDEEKE